MLCNKKFVRGVTRVGTPSEFAETFGSCGGLPKTPCVPDLTDMAWRRDAPKGNAAKGVPITPPHSAPAPIFVGRHGRSDGPRYQARGAWPSTWNREAPPLIVGVIGTSMAATVLVYQGAPVLPRTCTAKASE